MSAPRELIVVHAITANAGCALREASCILESSVDDPPPLAPALLELANGADRCASLLEYEIRRRNGTLHNVTELRS